PSFDDGRWTSRCDANRRMRHRTLGRQDADRSSRRHDQLPQKPTTVSALRKKTPSGLGTRGVGVERTTYRIRARLVEYKLEEDSDIHLVVADPKHPARTMI